MGGGKNFLVSAAGFSILGNGIFWWKAKTKRLFSQCTATWRPVEIYSKNLGILRLGDLKRSVLKTWGHCDLEICGIYTNHLGILNTWGY
jgi:hypothetical protein